MDTGAPAPQAAKPERDELVEAARALLPFIWESNFENESNLESEYEKAVFRLRRALATQAAPDQKGKL
jgi:hypothetical protein